MARKIPNQAKENNAHYKRIERYALMLDAVYQKATDEAVNIALLANQIGDTPFRWSDYPQTKAKLDQITRSFADDVRGVVVNGASAEWTQSNEKNDRLARAMLGVKKGEPVAKRFDRYFNHNDKALAQFIARKDGGGLDLSKRVWNLTEQFKSDMELSLSDGLLSGKNAAELSRDVRKHLNEPSRLFRRIRDDKGNLQLSNPAKAYHPGAGVYRSSYKNAQRLTRTEVNMAYRNADRERWSKMDFVVGFEVKRSGRGYDCSVCESLAGKYPKDFKFVGWHPSCRCYVIPILKTDDEFWAWDGRGEAPTSSVNEVKDVPQGFKDWVKNNSKRIEESKSLPYFLRDNSKLIPELYIANSKRFASLVDARVLDICDDLSVYSTLISLKSESRIMQKANNDYKGNISEVRDIVRTTIICDSSKFDDVFAGINSKFNVVRHKIQNEVRSGYSGHIFNVKTSGATFAEIQVNTPQIIYGKEVDAKNILGDAVFNEIKRKSGLENGLGHKLYEAYRVLDKDVDLEIIKELEKQSRKYYNALGMVKL